MPPHAIPRQVVQTRFEGPPSISTAVILTSSIAQQQTLSGYHDTIHTAPTIGTDYEYITHPLCAARVHNIR